MILKQFYKGQQKSEEVEESFYDFQNADIHSKLGTLTCNNDLSVITGENKPDEKTIAVVDGSGNVFLLSKDSGKIWKMDTSEVFTQPHTNGNGAHKGGGLFNSRIWYATAAKVGSFDGSTWTDTEGTFDNSNALKPFLKTGVNRAFAYFGDGAQLASINKDNSFNSNALEIPVDEIVTDLAEWGNDIVLASYIGSKKPISKIYRWNQYGDTYYKPDLVPEKFVSALFESTRSNLLFALVGEDGLLMNYTGTVLEQLKAMRDVTVSINPYNKTIFKGRSYIAIGNKIYSLHTSDPTLPFALVHEYTCSAEGATIDSLESDGDTLFATWHTDSDYGIDKIGSNKATATVTTPIVSGMPKELNVYYRSLPSGCSISAEIKVDGGSWQNLTMRNEPEMMRYAMYEGIPSENVNFCQFRITLNPSGANAPIINAVEVL